MLTVLVLAATACRSPLPSSSSGSTTRIIDVYAASPTASDAKSWLGGGEWWVGAPTFAQRPLDGARTSAAIKYRVVRRYANVGTAETWRVVYTAFTATSDATATMTSIQNSAGSGASGPSVGDKALYYGQQLSPVPGTNQGGAPYQTLTVIRSGAYVIESTWNRMDRFPSVSDLGKIGSHIVSRLREAVAGKLRGTPLSSDEQSALPPPNSSITQLGGVRLPVQAVGLMLNAAAPTEVAKLFTDANVTDFVFGDYVLNGDTHMEVQAAMFNFTTSSDASRIFDTFRGSVTPDANGLAKSYNDTTGPGQYDIEFVSGTRMGLMICRSTAEGSGEAASRACETPIQIVTAAWAASARG